MNVMTRVKYALQKVGFKAKQHKPEICFVLGIAALVGGTVLVIKESFEFKEKLDEANKKLDKIDEYADEYLDDSEDSEYTSEDYENDIHEVKKALIFSAITSYAAGIGVLCLSIVLFKSGFSDLAAKNGALLGIIAALKKDNESLRKKIIDTYGEEAYEKLRFGEPVAITDNGVVFDDDIPAGTGRFIFDARSPLWDKTDMDANMQLAREKLHKFNDILRYREYVWENDIREDFKVELDPLGYNNGWVYDKDVTHKISFGPALDFLYSYSYNNAIGEKDYKYDAKVGKDYICIELNCDGDIRNKVYRKDIA